MYNFLFILSLRRGRLDDPIKKDNKTLTPTSSGTPRITDTVAGNKLKRNVDVTRHVTTPHNLPSQLGNRLSKTTSLHSPRSGTQSSATPQRSQSFSRTDCGRYSMRNIKSNPVGGFFSNLSFKCFSFKKI